MIACLSNVIKSRHQNITILGDLNSNWLDQSLPQTKLLNTLCKQLVFSQLVLHPTREFGGVSSLLDVLITNNESCYKGTSVFPFSGSDHHIITTHYIARGVRVCAPHRYKRCRSYNGINDELNQQFS